MTNSFFAIFKYKDKKSQDVLGLFPQNVHIDAFPERRYLWTSRILVVLSVFSICLTIMLASTIYLLLPQRGATPKLYKQQEFYNGLELVQPLEVKISPEPLVIENIIRKYIKLRHEFPKSYTELNYKWNKDSEFYQLSTTKTYFAFINKMDVETSTKIIMKKMVRNVEIEWIKKLTSNLWVAQFITYTSSEKVKKPIKAFWRAYIRIDFQEIGDDAKPSYEANPQGIKVSHYSLAYIGDGENDRSYLDAAKSEATKKQRE